MWAEDGEPTAWVEVDLGALESNLAVLGRRFGDARILAVVKADAYGHGAAGIIGTLERCGVHSVGVARIDEGLRLRSSGTKLPILVLGVVPASRIPECIDNDLLPVISSLSQLKAWDAKASELGSSLPVHLKLDVGMHRLGIVEDEWPLAASLLEGSRLRLEGVLGHLSEGANPGSPRNTVQEACFARGLGLFSALGSQTASPGTARQPTAQQPMRHLASSGAALHRPNSRWDLVRLGLALYGLDPARRLKSLQPALSLRACVVQTKTIAAGERVGYGGLWVANRESRIGIVPVGYADGYPWRAGGRGWALVGGQRVAVIGAVSMDMLCLDLTDLREEQRQEGAAVTLIGVQGDDQITTVEVASWGRTSTYELLCRLALRLPRRYRDAQESLSDDASQGIDQTRADSGSSDSAAE